MKEQNWDDAVDAPEDILEATTVLIDDEDEVLEKPVVLSDKIKFTQMRRRIEDRLDSKRLSLEFDYE